MLQAIAAIFLLATLGILGWWKSDKLGSRSKIAASALIVAVALFQGWGAFREQIDAAKEERTALSKPDVIYDAKDTTFSVNLVTPDDGDALDGIQLSRVFQLLGTDLIVEKPVGQSIKVSTTVRDRQGKILAQLLRNQWNVNENGAFDLNYSRDALEVADQNGRIVLQVQLVEDGVRLHGIFLAEDTDGLGFEIGTACNTETGKMVNAFHFINPGHKPRLWIWPLFRYPSNLHPGEVNNQPDPSENLCASQMISKVSGRKLASPMH